MLLDLNTSGQAEIVLEIPYTQSTTHALLCAGDRVLMRIYEEGESEIQMWEADGSMKSLLKTDKQLALLSCR